MKAVICVNGRDEMKAIGNALRKAGYTFDLVGDNDQLGMLVDIGSGSPAFYRVVFSLYGKAFGCSIVQENGTLEALYGDIDVSGLIKGLFGPSLDSITRRVEDAMEQIDAVQNILLGMPHKYQDTCWCSDLGEASRRLSDVVQGMVLRLQDEEDGSAED